jgi:hypothetical protein
MTEATPVEAAPEGTARGRYENLRTDRDPYLERAREASLLTIPSLIPPEGFNSTSRLYRPAQSLGARGVNTLSAKLLMALLPPNSPFFRMLVDPSVADKMSQDAEFKTQVEAALSKYEKVVMTDIEGSTDRVALFEALKHLIVGGNILLHLAKDGMRVFHLDKFVCKRDPAGHPLEMVVKECIAKVSLPPEIKEYVDADPDNKDSKTVDVFTHIVRNNDHWDVQQEVCGKKIPSTYGNYPLDKSPWLPLRLIRIDGEDYGRGYVEEYIGDLDTLEQLTRAITEASKAAAKVLFLVKPNGSTQLKTLKEAPNLAIRSGNADDVTVLQMQKQADLQVAKAMVNDLQTSLAYAFLMQNAIQRQAERVTAEEIRYMASELDQMLGGVYGIMSQDFQLPYLNRKVAVLNRSGKLPRLPKGLVKVSIVTGIEALGRGNDRSKLVQFATTLEQVLGPQAMQYINGSDFISRLASADGIDPEGLVKPQEQVQQEQMQAAQQAMAQRVAPNVVNHAGNMMANAQQQNGQNEQPQQ